MRRKKPRIPLPPSPKQQLEEPFHSPFRDIKEQLQAIASTPPPAALPPATLPPAAPAAVPPRRSSDVLMQREKAVFLAEMAGVTPLPKDSRGRVEKLHQPSPKALYSTDECEALADLQDLVEGRGAFTIQYTDEYMEGIAPGIDRHLAQRLHRGDYAVQAHIDLHGHTVEEAKIAVDRFLNSAYVAGQRCVLLIHGRGRNSKDNRPVLKEQVRIWLSHGRLSRLVLAFATAPLTDGGAGAVYVLLRRAPRFQKK
jgi:DNA-nicking Smr family endonuclease